MGVVFRHNGVDLLELVSSILVQENRRNPVLYQGLKPLCPFLITACDLTGEMRTFLFVLLTIVTDKKWGKIQIFRAATRVKGEYKLSSGDKYFDDSSSPAC